VHGKELCRHLALRLTFFEGTLQRRLVEQIGHRRLVLERLVQLRVVHVARAVFIEGDEEAIDSSIGGFESYLTQR
jgi:hypothetical protein